MRGASNAFAEAVKEVYEPAWSEREKLVTLYDVCITKKCQISLNTIRVIVNAEVLRKMLGIYYNS